EQLEPSHDDRNFVLRRDRFVFRVAHHRAHVPSRQESLHPAILRTQNRLHSRGDQHMRHQHGKIRNPLLLRLVHRHRVRRSRSFESHRKEHNFLVRVLARDPQRIHRRIQNAYISALRFHREQITFAARNPEHVSEGAEDHLGPFRNPQRFINLLQRRHAHRTPRPMHQRDLLRQQLVNAILHDRVSLPAANLHQRPRPRRHLRNRPRILLCRLRIPILSHVFQIANLVSSPSSCHPFFCHAEEGFSPTKHPFHSHTAAVAVIGSAVAVYGSSAISTSPICTRYSNTCFASASSILLIANPTCTST